ncbi:MAG TPA: transcription antitermination factor NusB [Hyphomicrobiales bacterium]|nr:transcription antitermination factor NusB [Hyphomicrobiales bacterium]
MNADGTIPISYRKRARDLLVQALYQWQLAGAEAEQIEAEFRADNGRKTDWTFFHNALDAITREPAVIDAHYQGYLDRRGDELDPIELGILRLGVFELANCLEVPYKVVLNEYVELAKKYGATDSHKYVNGILDKAARQLRQVEWGR